MDPSVIAGLEYEEFTSRVAPGARGGIAQQERLRAVWENALDSIGCAVGESLDVEAKLMVEGLGYIEKPLDMLKRR
ncbi:MAG: hypothetical protein JW882_13795 [Deltaproteobacteria bacterium]|nr:hypothetical protein [Deltaproteobacteria bacterium]